MLAYWFELFSAHGVKQVLLNSHHLHEQVAEFVRTIQTQLHVTLVYEPILLGSAGTLRLNRAFAEDVSEFFVVYADNLANVDLTALVTAQRRMGKIATLGLFRASVPTECGVVILDRHGIITDFQEKPRHPVSRLAFGGIMVASPKIFDLIPEQVPCDLGRDVFGKLLGRMAGYELNGYLRDIGTLEGYSLAQREAATIWANGR